MRKHLVGGDALALGRSQAFRLHNGLALAGSVLVPILTVGTQPPALVSIQQCWQMFYNNAVCGWTRGAQRACLENLYRASFQDENPRK